MYTLYYVVHPIDTVEMNICIGINTDSGVNVGYAVEQLVEALHYKPEGHGFDSQWNFSLT